MEALVDAISFDFVIWVYMKDHFKSDDRAAYPYIGWHLPAYWPTKRYYIGWRE